MDVNPGTFDETLTLYSYSQTRGTEGQKIESYTAAAIVCASIKYADTDSVDSENATPKRTITATMYKRLDMDTRWQAEWRGKRFAVSTIDADERMSHYMNVTLVEV